MNPTFTSSLTDLDEYQSILSRPRIQLTLTSTTGFRARVRGGRLGRVRLLCVTEELPRIGFLTLPDDGLFISFPTQPGTPQMWRGIELQPGDMVLHRPGEHLHQRTSGLSHWGFIEAKFEDVVEWHEVLTGHEFPSQLLGHILRPPSPDAIRLLNLQAESGRLFGADPEIFSHPEVIRAIESNIIHALVECLTASPIREDTLVQRRRSDVMARFEAAIAPRSDRPSSNLEELCAQIGISERSLNDCSQSLLGMRSDQYLLLRRLYILRDAIRAGRAVAADFDAISRRYGFVDVGRMNAAYLATFGETPQDTIGRGAALL